MHKMWAFLSVSASHLTTCPLPASLPASPPCCPRSAAWWLGENGNFGAGEYAWMPRPLTAELVAQLAAADSCSQAQMAAAAVAMNPVLALIIARLQRVMVTGLWEVRLAAAQVSCLQARGPGGERVGPLFPHPSPLLWCVKFC